MRRRRSEGSGDVDADDGADRDVALEAFRPCLPKRGAKAKDDRPFPEALHVTWRALPERFGRRNTAWRRFDRLSRSGVFEGLFATRADPGRRAHPVRMSDSTAARAPVPAAGARGGSRTGPPGARAAAAARRSA